MWPSWQKINNNISYLWKLFAKLAISCRPACFSPRSFFYLELFVFPLHVLNTKVSFFGITFTGYRLCYNLGQMVGLLFYFIFEVIAIDIWLFGKGRKCVYCWISLSSGCKLTFTFYILQEEKKENVVISLTFDYIDDDTMLSVVGRGTSVVSRVRRSGLLKHALLLIQSKQK